MNIFQSASLLPSSRSLCTLLEERRGGGRRMGGSGRGGVGGGGVKGAGKRLQALARPTVALVQPE